MFKWGSYSLGSYNFADQVEIIILIEMAPSRQLHLSSVVVGSLRRRVDAGDGFTE